jgi:predicted nucleic acid-binding protein
MLIYLDTVVVIYAIEGAAALQTRSRERLASANSAADELATSDLTRLECLVHPIRRNDPVLHPQYLRFLQGTKILNLPASVFDKAAGIRARHNYEIADSLHLAAALLGGCGLFLTNDNRLSGFPDIQVEILP